MTVEKFSHRTRKRQKQAESLEFLLNLYDAYLREKNIKRCADVLGMSFNILWKMKSHPNIQLVFRVADSNRGKAILANYVLQHLSPQAKRTWDKIQKASTLQEVDAIFRTFGQGATKIRQQLFCHALLRFGYNLTHACNAVAITRIDLQVWRRDLDFLQLLEEVQFHKKNFFENALIGLVSENHPGAIMFANRTLNRDRGYGERLILQSEGHPSGFDLADLDLDLDTQKKILAAIEKKKAEQPPELPQANHPLLEA